MIVSVNLSNLINMSDEAVKKLGEQLNLFIGARPRHICLNDESFYE